jgi:glycerol 3-phosphatase-1
MKLTEPDQMVVAEDVSAGKPDPAPYLLGAQRLGLSRGHMCVVFEDAPAGVRSGKAAGFKVVGLATTHKVEQLVMAGADWIVKDLRSVKLEDCEKGVVKIRVSDALVL